MVPALLWTKRLPAGRIYFAELRVCGDDRLMDAAVVGGGEEGVGLLLMT